VEVIKQRQKSILPSMIAIKTCNGDEAALDQVRGDDAARNHFFITTVSPVCLHCTLIFDSEQVGHFTWSQVAALFEDLARRGLTTEEDIRAAYMENHKLLWQLLTALTRLENLRLHQWGRLIQSLSVAPRFAPFLRRFRASNFPFVKLSCVAHDRLRTQRGSPIS
jgi:hypothetical protein